MKILTPIHELRAYYLNDGYVEEFPGIIIERYSFNESYLKIRFKPGLIFGVQYISVLKLGNVVVFAHKDIEHRILFTSFLDCPSILTFL